MIGNFVSSVSFVLCRSRPTAATQELPGCRTAAIAFLPFVHLAAFCPLDLQSTDKAPIRCEKPKIDLFGQCSPLPEHELTVV